MNWSCSSRHCARGQPIATFRARSERVSVSPCPVRLSVDTVNRLAYPRAPRGRPGAPAMSTIVGGTRKICAHWRGTFVPITSCHIQNSWPGSDSRRCLAGWRSDFSGRWFLPEEQSDLYDALKDHLDDSQLWQQMEHVRGSLEIYHKACLDSLSSLLKMAASTRYAGLPVVSIAEPNPPSIPRGSGKVSGMNHPGLPQGRKTDSSPATLENPSTLILEACR